MYHPPAVRFLAVTLLFTMGPACGDDGVPLEPDAGSGIIVLGEVRRAMLGARFDELGPVEGAMVCAYMRPELPCATTNAVGEFELAGLAPRSEVAITVSAAGHRSAVLPFVTDDRPVRPSLALEPLEVIDARDEAAGASPAPGTGSIGFVVAGATGGLAGVRVTATPAGEGPFYVDADHAVDTSLSATTTRGFGFVLGLPAGTVELSLEPSPDPRGSGIACDVPALGWPAGPNAARAPVVPGHETAVAVVCRPL